MSLSPHNGGNIAAGVKDPEKVLVEKAMELQRGGPETRRGRERFSEMSGLRRSPYRNGSDEGGRLRNKRGLREQEQDSVGKRDGSVAAAGHGAAHLAGRLRTASVVFAFLRVLRLRGGGRRFTVSGAEALVATSHAVRLPSGGPEGSPKQSDG